MFTLGSIHSCREQLCGRLITWELRLEGSRWGLSVYVGGLSAGLKLPTCGTILEMMRAGPYFASQSWVLIFVWAMPLGTSSLQAEQLGLWQL